MLGLNSLIRKQTPLLFGNRVGWNVLEFGVNVYSIWGHEAHAVKIDKEYKIMIRIIRFGFIGYAAEHLWTPRIKPRNAV